MIDRKRACGVCHKADIPFGVDWPWWQEGRPVHLLCASTCQPAHPAPVIPSEWTRTSPGIYVDAENVAHVVPHEILAAAGLPHTLETEQLVYDEVARVFAGAGVAVEEGEPLR